MGIGILQDRDTIAKLRQEIETWKRTFTAFGKRYDDLAAADAHKARRITSLEHVVAQQAADHLELVKSLNTTENFRIQASRRVAELEAALAHAAKAPTESKRIQRLLDAIDLRTDELKTALARNAVLEKQLSEATKAPAPTGMEIRARVEADKAVIAFYETHMKIGAWIKHLEHTFTDFKQAMMNDYDQRIQPVEGDAKADVPRPSTAGAMGMGKVG